MERQLTPEQAAIELSVHPITVRKWLREGLLRGEKKGKRLWRVPESALKESGKIGARHPENVAQIEAVWDSMTSGDTKRRNEALQSLPQLPESVRTIIMQRSTEAAARYYASPEGKEELADWRALDGEPFYEYDDEDGTQQ